MFELFAFHQFVYLQLHSWIELRGLPFIPSESLFFPFTSNNPSEGNSTKPMVYFCCEIIKNLRLNTVNLIF